MSIDPAFTLLFPADQQAYAARYFTEAKSATGRLFGLSDEHFIEALLPQLLVSDMPRLVDRQAGLAALEDGARNDVSLKRALLVRAMRGAFPPLANEQIRDETVDVLADGNELGPVGAVMYCRTTDLGKLMVLDTSKHVDVVSGQISYVAPAQPSIAIRSPVPSAPVPVRSSHLPSALAKPDDRDDDGDGSAVGMSLFEGACNVATMALFALGPAGILYAAGLSAFECIFKLAADAGKTPVSIPKAVDEIVKADLVGINIEKDLNPTLALTSWIARQNEAALTGKLTDSYVEAHPAAVQDFSNVFSDACNPNQPLLISIEDLKGKNDDDPTNPVAPDKVLGLPGFCLAASTHILCEKGRLLSSTDNTSTGSLDLSDMAGAAQQYIDHIDAIVKLVDTAIKNRQAQVGPPAEMYLSVDSSMRRPGMRPPTVYCLVVIDSETKNFPPRQKGEIYDGIVFRYDCKPSGCASSPTVPDDQRTSAQAYRNQYLAGLKASIETKMGFDGSRRDDLAAFRAELVKVVALNKPNS